MDKAALPTKKVGYGILISSLTGIAVWILNAYVLSVPIPAEQGMAIATAITFAVQYYVTDTQK